jgi:aryl carrier-like protein
MTMADVDLNMLGELVQRIHNDVRALRDQSDRMASGLVDIRGELADIKDQLLVQGAILVKLETGAVGGDSARMLQMLQRLQRRLEALEQR